MLRKVASSYLFRRLIKALVTIFVMASLTFFLIRLMPGGPVEAYITNLVTQYNVSHQSAVQQAASLFSLDLNAPIYQQYLEYLANLVRGDLGESLVSRGVPVSQIVLTYLPWTLFSVGTALIIEWLYVYEGLGYVLYNSIQQRDYPVMQGVFLVITTMVILANLLADLLYSRLDPRIRIGGKD